MYTTIQSSNICAKDAGHLLYTELNIYRIKQHKRMAENLRLCPYGMGHVL